MRNSYRINNIFYSLQGEGRNTGRAAAFVRFAGCNLRCPFCDTEFDSYREMTADEILQEIARLSSFTSPLSSFTSPLPSRFIVLTGGEPTLQVDEHFVDLLHQEGYEVAMESNGTRPAPRNLDWLTVSPKVVDGGRSMVDGEGKAPDEIKIVFEENTAEMLSSPASPLSSLLSPLSSLPSLPSPPLLYLQPCDTGDSARNAFILQQCISYIKQHPQWRLSLQTHKLIGIE
ncbi:MAG: 7-carboxy-7-deazaguanine synthase QueE [Prevotella sp.]|nr:7-carboxy-7-deazaguanine synthase QueE [Prevotella sp.]